MVWFSKWLVFSLGYSYCPNHLKTRPSKILTFLSGFQMVLDKMAGICSDLSVGLPDFRSFENRTICNPTSFQPFKIQTSPDFRSLLYNVYSFFRIVCSGQFLKPVLSQAVRNLNANRAVVTKTKRALFERTYPTLLALQDGATIEINYPQPKLLLKYDNLFRENPNTGHPITGFLLIIDFNLVFRCPVSNIVQYLKSLVYHLIADNSTDDG